MNEELSKKIKALKPGRGFTVNHSERVRVLQLARGMKNLGLIKHDVVTREDKDGNFRVRAI